MSDATGTIIGIRRRLPSGRKLAVRGGREGLFVPTALSRSGRLLICEGPTDTAAMLGLGFAALGRPSCSGGTRFVGVLARAREVVIVADGDEPGRHGAIRLATTLHLHCPKVDIISPPPGVKDARAWVGAGATRHDIESTLANGPIVRFCEHTDRAERVSYRETG